MRKLLVWGVLAAAMLLPGPVRAQEEAPWCLKATVGRGVGERCHFRTFEACREERTLYGTTAFCSQNPRYLPYWHGRFGEEPRPKTVRKSKQRRQRH